MDSQDILQGIRRFERRPFTSVCRNGCLYGPDQDRFVSLLVEFDISDRKSAYRFAVVAVGERKKERPLLAFVKMCMEAHLKRDFHRTRTVVGKKESVQIARYDFAQPFGKPYRRFVCEAGKQNMLESARLFGQLFRYIVVRVPEKVDPPAAYGVYVPVAVEVFQPYTFCGSYRNERKRLVVFHLGTGVPYVSEITLHHLIIVHIFPFSPLLGVSTFVKVSDKL